MANKIRWLTYSLFFLATVLQGMVGIGFVNSSYTTLERRFKFTSSFTGFISGASSLGSLLTVIPVSFLASRKGASKLRFVAVSLFCIGLGSGFFVLPHFLSSPVIRNDLTDASTSAENICESNLEAAEKLSPHQQDDLPGLPAFFVFGNLLHGIGTACFFPIGAVLLEELVGDCSIAISIWLSMFAVGPALGYGAQGLLLKIDTDVGRNSSMIDGASEDHQWFGAWWIGFLFSVVMAWSLAAIFFFGNSWLLKRPEEPTETEPQPESSIIDHLKKMPHTLLNLVKNSTYVLTIVFMATDGMIVSSLAAFMPKYFELQYQFTTSQATLFVGLLCTAGAMLGSILGGLIMDYLALKRSGCIRLYIASQTIALCLVLGFLLSCPQIEMTPQITTTQTIVKGTPPDFLNLPCNENCHCSSTYQPVCGSNNILYYNPCFAGCRNQTMADGKPIFTDCSCVGNVTESGTATAEPCKTKCNNYIYFGIVLFFAMTLFYTPSKPALKMITHCLTSNKATTGLAVQSFVFKILGSIPAPIILGKLNDKACLLFFETCLIYANFSLSIYTMSFVLVARAIGVVIAVAAHHQSMKLGTDQPTEED